MNAIYAGSFDPFTNGHYDIAMRAAELFDTLYIVIANNPLKKRKYDIVSMKTAIYSTFVGVDNIIIMSTDGFISDLANEMDVNYLVRGLRNNQDYFYEEEVAKINKELSPTLETIYLRANYDTISSTMVKMLHSNNKDVAKYVPKWVYEVMKGKE
jgi:pantetheine-phosphate adenylyltransferase